MRQNIHPYLTAEVLAYAPNILKAVEPRQGRVLRPLVPQVQRQAPQRPPHHAGGKARGARAGWRLMTQHCSVRAT